MTDPTSTPPEGTPPTAEQPAAPPPGPAGDAGGAPYAGQPGPDAQPGYGPPPGGYAPAPETGYGPPPEVGRPADIGVRFLARLIDFILVGIVAAIIDAIIGSVANLHMGGVGYSVGASIAGAIISAVISAVLYLGYFTLMESRNGQTVGKMALKLQTQGPGGGTPTTEEAFRRNAWTGLAILGVVPVVGALIGALLTLLAEIMIWVTVAQSPVKEGWHDRFAGGTRVVRIG